MSLPPAPTRPVPFREALGAWVRIAAQSFGGPAGQIAVIHRVVVEEKRWLDEPRFLHALGYCMLLPGPEAQQLVTYAGWLLHGTRGGLAAGLLFILPGFLSLLALSILYGTVGHVGVVAAMFAGLKPAVFAIVLDAMVRLRHRAPRNRLAAGIAAAAFAAIFAFGVPFPLIVLAAGVVGWLTGRRRPVLDQGPTAVPRPSMGRLARTTLVWLAIWLGPVLILLATLGAGHILVREAAFFSRAAVVTFGGAYAVLAYLAQQAVAGYGWVTPAEMIDGLGLAETTPGPLIMVVQFVGYLAAARQMEGVSPVLAGIAGSLVTTWVTFAPCFLFIFAGAPWIEWLRGHRGLTAALEGVMAAVAGVVLNLAVWFALHVLFREVGTVAAGPLRLAVPAPASLDPVAAVIALLAVAATFRWRLGMGLVLGGGAAAGVLVWGIRAAAGG